MKGFGGFKQKGRLIKVPGAFFSELLPDITSVSELKVTLYCFWWFTQREDAHTIRQADFIADKVFMEGLGHRTDEQVRTLQEGLELAVTRGTLLQIVVERGTSVENYYLINSPRGRAIAEAAERGEWNPGAPNGTALDLRVERPNVFTLYEQNIGALTPMIADSLRDLSNEVSEDWITDAIQLAVEHNKRNMKYIEAIITRWKQEGRVSRDKKDDPADWQKFLKGKYSDKFKK